MQLSKSLGFKGASLLAVYCVASTLSSCVNESMNPTSSIGTDGKLVLDLTTADYALLNTVGNYVIVSSIVVARVSTAAFSAVTQVCSHQGQKRVVFNAGEFFCAVHGARFDTAGKGFNANGSCGLKIYATALQGTILKVSL